MRVGALLRLGLAATILGACGGEEGSGGARATRVFVAWGADGRREQPGPRSGALITFDGKLFAEDGRPATFTITVLQNRKPGGSVECFGSTYDERYTSQVSEDTGEGNVEIDAVGEATFAFDREVGAFPGRSGLPTCEEFTGTYEGTSGELEGRDRASHLRRRPRARPRPLPRLAGA
jgi:hypothetical protein